MEVEVETEVICAICSGSSSSQSKHSAGAPNEADHETFENFCTDILNVAVKDNGDGEGAALPRLSSGFSICEECLVLLKKAVECRELTRYVEDRVKKVQLQMLAELTELKRRMEWFYLDVKIIAEIVNRSRSRSKTEEQADVSVLRGEILKVENSLAFYTTKLTRKLLISDSDEDEDEAYRVYHVSPYMLSKIKLEACDDDDSNEVFENLNVPDVEAAVTSPSLPSTSSELPSSTPKTGKKRRKGKGRASFWYKKRTATVSKSGEQSRKIVNVCKSKLQNRNNTDKIQRTLEGKYGKRSQSRRVSVRIHSHSMEVPEVASDKIPNDPDLEDNVKILKRAVPVRKRVKCKDCLRFFSDLKGLRIHMRVHEGKQKLYRGSDVPPPLTIQSDFDDAGDVTNKETGTNVQVTKVRSRKKKHKCQLCDYSCRGPQALQRHMKHHDQEGRPFKCTQCNCYFSTAVALTSHKDFRHKNVKHKIRLIRSNIEVIESTDKDIKKRFKCKLCGKTFGMRNNTNIHIKTVHWKYRPFKCPEPNCPRAFGRKKALENHKFAHLGLKPFECLVCKSKFSRQFDLKRHVTLHHPEAVPEGSQDSIAGASGHND